MIPKPITKEIQLKDGRTISLETGKLAKQADGSVVVRMGGTMLLATVVSNKEPSSANFLPLTVEYKEKFAATGRVPGGFFKREGRPTEDEILIMRLVDRVLRPMFPDDYRHETQVIISLISYDPEVAPDSLAGLAASSALAVSDIPFAGPLSEVRVARVDGQWQINPSPANIEKADIDLMVGATMDSVAMVEGEMKEASEAEMIEAIQIAHEAIKDQVRAQIELAAEVPGSSPKREYEGEEQDEELAADVRKATYDKIKEVAAAGIADKHERTERFKAIREEYLEGMSEEEREEKEGLVKRYFHDTEYHAVRDVLLEKGIRLDGRKPDEIRPIWAEADYLPGAHGSAVFTRGETQSLTTVTLGSKLDENRIDGVTYSGTERFYLHYNFPPFSTGEARPMRGTSRREVGHGNLAQRALQHAIPGDSPYTIRIVSDILESNGSSSMATVCAGSLALMDAGIQITKPVSGIAMGLVTDPETGRHAVLSDILGDEDHLGDMDFKVTGTRDGITACQMDIKVKGLPYDVLEKALDQARKGRLHIMDKMLETLPEPRTQLKPNAPKIVSIEIPKDYIGAIIGPGGKVIQGLQSELGTIITIEESDTKGIVEISGTDQENLDETVRRIRDIAFEPEVGATYEGTVKSIQPYGAFVEINKGTDGLLHISEIDWRRLEKVEEELKEGDKVKVKLLSIDDRGKLKLSRKALLPKPENTHSR